MDRQAMKVLVNGLGNIGSTLVNLLLEYKEQLGISEIHACKRSIENWNLSELSISEESGVQICSIGSDGYPQFKEIAAKMDYIFEATPEGVGMQNRSFYEGLPNLKGASAQGSEKGFGIPFMTGINEAKIFAEQFVNIVSCNSHGSAAILKTFCGNQLENLSKADFVVVRRSEDLGNHERLVTANVVARHLDEKAGTHHSIDVIDLFKTIGINCELTASDITTPSQLTHSVRFNIAFSNEFEDPRELIAANEYVSSTSRFDSNVIFELGRRYGFNGRIYSHAIIVSSNLLVNENSIKGWAFVPQEGNSILSTIHAFLLQTEHPNVSNVMTQMKTDLLKSEW